VKDKTTKMLKIDILIMSALMLLISFGWFVPILREPLTCTPNH